MLNTTRALRILTAVLLLTTGLAAGPAAADDPSAPRLELAHAPPAAALVGHDLELSFGYRSDCFVFCGKPTGRLVVADSRQYFPVTSTGTLTAGTMTVTIPGDVLTGEQLRYRFTVSQRRCAIFRGCHTGSASTGWHDVPLLDPNV